MCTQPANPQRGGAPETFLAAERPAAAPAAECQIFKGDDPGLELAHLAAQRLDRIVQTLDLNGMSAGSSGYRSRYELLERGLVLDLPGRGRDNPLYGRRRWGGFGRTR